jgi:hypothetical protein
VFSGDPCSGRPRWRKRAAAKGPSSAGASYSHDSRSRAVPEGRTGALYVAVTSFVAGPEGASRSTEPAGDVPRSGSVLLDGAGRDGRRDGEGLLDMHAFGRRRGTGDQHFVDLQVVGPCFCRAMGVYSV